MLLKTLCQNDFYYQVINLRHWQETRCIQIKFTYSICLEHFLCCIILQLGLLRYLFQKEKALIVQVLSLFNNTSKNKGCGEEDLTRVSMFSYMIPCGLLSGMLSLCCYFHGVNDSQWPVFLLPLLVILVFKLTHLIVCLGVLQSHIAENGKIRGRRGDG